MNIEEAIKVIKNMKFDLYSGLSCKECIFDNDTKCIKENGEDCQVIAIETLLTAYEKEKKKNKKAIDFINDEKNYFEDGENWQNILKIKEILEE